MQVRSEYEAGTSTVWTTATHDSAGSVRCGSVSSEPVPVLPVSVRAVSTRFRVLNTFLKNQDKNRFQDDHSKFEFLGCERMQGSPRGGGEATPPGGTSE